MPVITGTNGGDSLVGTAADDVINSGNGDDILDGGNGSDRLSGGAGRDILAYELSANSASADNYSGGAGIDTLRLQFTGAEWHSAAVRHEIARYVQHLATVKKNPNTGEVSSGSASDFTFAFGNGNTLVVSMMERLEIWVDNREIDYRAPTIATAKESGAVQEDAAPQLLSDVGTIRFSDIEIGDRHAIAVSPAADNPLGGILSAVLSDSASDDGEGVVSWTYQLDNTNTRVQALAAGQSVIERFSVSITDAAGRSVTQAVQIAVSGTNDAPDIRIAVGDSAAVSLIETNGPLLASGTLTVTDADANDSVAATVESVTVTISGGNNPQPFLDNATFKGMLTLDDAAANHAEAGASGNLGWYFDSTVDNGLVAFNRLSRDQIMVLDYVIKVTDSSGEGSDTQVLQFTVTGTNDEVQITSMEQAGVVRDAQDAPALASGTVSFNDVDVADRHVASFVPAGSNTTALGSFALGPVEEGSRSTSGSVNWSYALNSEAARYLAANQQVTETYTVMIDDRNGSIATQDVIVTIVGSNDAPEFSVAAGDSVAASLIEADGPLTATGTLTLADADENDTVSVAVESLHIDRSRAPGADTLLTDDMVKGMLTVQPEQGVAGNLRWNFDSDIDGLIPFNRLARDQQVVLTYTLRATDSSGEGSDTQDVTITITGTNDPVRISNAQQAGTVVEDADITVSQSDAQNARGTISFSDIDTADRHTATFSPSPANKTALGTFTLSPVSEEDAALYGSVDWNYTLNNAAAQYLSANQQVREVYRVTIDDQNGSKRTQDVVITIIGTDEAAGSLFM